MPLPSLATVNDQTGVSVSTVPVSPTGAPVIPPAVVPWLTGIVGLAVLGAQVLPPYTIAAHVCAGIVSLAGLFGLVSPGLRRPQVPSAPPAQ